jgi:hypothetical protein
MPELRGSAIVGNPVEHDSTDGNPVEADKVPSTSEGVVKVQEETWQFLEQTNQCSQKIHLCCSAKCVSR